MTYSLHSRAVHIVSLAFLLTSGLPRNAVRGCEATAIETGVALAPGPVPGTATETTTSTTSSINPWPTDTIYTYPPESECIVATSGAPPGDCVLAMTVHSSDPGFVRNYCGFANFTTTETRTLTMDCGGCGEAAVTVRRGGCPLGLPRPPPPISPQPTPYYWYRWECATSAVPSAPAIPACPTAEI
ncbi:hypothetical protein F4802DRAFT_220394 [Xylaria palmicola]|nr:hypothetical protein F4802DRAFT_220394 [Xylaria palmicola]